MDLEEGPLAAKRQRTESAEPYTTSAVATLSSSDAAPAPAESCIVRAKEALQGPLVPAEIPDFDEKLKVILKAAKHLSSHGGKGQRSKAILTDLMHRLYEDSKRLQAALDLHSLPEVPEYCRQEPSFEAAKRIAMYAHRLSYTTFAPATSLGQNLFRPPAPQDWDFRASILHKLTVEESEGTAAPAPAEPDVTEDRRESGEAGAERPPQPEAEMAKKAAVEEGSRPQAKVQPPQAISGLVSSAFDFILNPELEEADEDYSSSEEESE